LFFTAGCFKLAVASFAKYPADPRNFKCKPFGRKHENFVCRTNEGRFGRTRKFIGIKEALLRRPIAISALLFYKKFVR